MRTGAFAPPQRGTWPHCVRALASLILPFLVGLLAGPARAGGGEHPLSRQFTLHFDPQQVEIIQDEQNGYDRIRYPHLTDYQPPEWAGAPCLPALQREFLVPEGYRVADLEIQLTQPVLLPGDIHPYPIPDGSGEPVIPDPDYYDGGVLFPPVTHRVTANSAYRSFRLARIVILPFEYLGSAAALRLYRQAEVTVRFEPVPLDEGLPLRLRPDRQLSRGRYEADWIRERVLNAEDFEGFYPEGDPRGKSVVTDTTHATGFHPTERPSVLGPSVDMVIITGTAWTGGQDLSGDMTVPFQRLADWRTRSGIPTVVRAMQWIRDNYEGVDDPARIRSFLKDAYSKWGTDFALLGGSVEVVPARMVLTGGGSSPSFFAEDMPTDYYYSGLDGNWNADLDAYHEVAEIYDGQDQYPDLWVGRLPARNSLEAERIVDKVCSYERVPGYTAEAPPDTFYTKALLAAGLTNSGVWGNWNNGIYNAEMLWSEVLNSTGFAASRLYPCLDGSASCGGASLECYYDTKAYFASYPPGDVFSGSHMRSHILADKPAILFHYEHSSWAHLGGPTRSGNVQPSIAGCVTAHPECSDCPGWSGACWTAYLSCNSEGGLSREVAMDLENGPSYFVGLSFGSHVGRFELDSVAEALVRAPSGGAVAFVAKATSYTTVGDTTAVTQVQIQTFAYLLEHEIPLAVALQSAILDQSDPARRGSRLIWHCFGDPTLQVWNQAPSTLSATCYPATLGLKGIKPFNITVNENGSPVEGARVTLFRDDDIFAVTESDASGQAKFPSVLLANVTDSVEVVCTLPNAAPVRLKVGPTSDRPLFGTQTPLVYRRHAYSDSARNGPTEGVIDAGDRVDLDVLMTNLGSRTASAGTAWLVPTPRVKATALIDGEFDAEKVCIGLEKAHPPAFADTFCVLVNEYAIRPEGPAPNMATESVWYLWRDDLSRYHARAAYGSGDIGVAYDALFVADGGLSVVESKGTEAGDDWGISADGDSLWISFTGDGTDDELIWRAQAVDWITAVVDSVAYDSVRTNQSTTCSFRFDIATAAPPRTRLDFTVAAQGSLDGAPAFTDFPLDLRASDVALGTVQDADTLYNPQYVCDPGDTLFALPFWLSNTGDGAADSVWCRVVLSGANVTAHVDTVWFNLDPGEAEGTNPFLFCDQGRTCAVDTLELACSVNGEKEVLELLTDLDPWPNGDADYLTGEPTTWPEPEGVRLIWAEPPETTGVWGYAVWMETDTIPERTMLVPRSDPRHVHLRELPHGDAAEPIAYRFGVATVLETRRETEPVWSWWAHPNLDERPGWPRKTPKGMANSVALVDLDDDGELEVVTAGRVLAAWKADGSSATANEDALLFDPDPTTHTVMRRQFYGEIAAGELFGIGEMGVVGAFGNDSLYAIEADGSLAWVKPLAARSGPTLADLDGDGDLEVVIADFRSGKIHALCADGSPYRGSTTEFAQPPDPGDYNPLGVAVGHWGEDDTLSIVQATTNGYIHCWRASTGWFSAPDKRRSWSYRVGTGLTSTPTVADFDRDGTQDVIFSTRQSASTSWVKVVDGADSAATLCSWQLPGLAINKDFPQVPVVLELGNGGYREVLVGRRARKLSDYTYALDPATKAMILYQSGSSAPQDSCEAELPLPGRRGEISSETIGSPVVADIDGDEKLEIMIGSNQGGLFVWEVEWNSQTQTWDSTPEPGWPIVLPDLLSSFALGDIDGDDFLELVIPMQDGYVHAYDLAGLSTGDVPWPMAGHDVRRTGNESGGGSGVPRQVPPALLPTDTGLSLAGRNPSAGEVSIRYRVPGRTRVELAIYDIRGRTVRTLVPAGEQERGVYAQEWDGRTDAGHLASSGIYFVQARIGTTRLTKKVVLSR